MSFLIAKNTLVSSIFLGLCCRSDLRPKQVCTLEKGDSNIKKLNNSLYMHETETVIEILCQQETKIRMIYLFLHFWALFGTSVILLRLMASHITRNLGNEGRRYSE